MTGRLFAAGLWGLLILCLLELAARTVLFPQYTAMLPDMYAPHPVLGHYNKPNLEVRRYNPMNYDVINRTNALGLRGLEKDREKELAGIWIAGASNTFGGYVEDGETYAAQLSRHGYSAANLASEGHGVANQTMVIRMLADKGYRPRAVLLTLTMYQVITDYRFAADVFTRPLGAALASETKAAPRPRDNLRRGAEELAGLVPDTLQSVRARLLKSSALYGWLKVGIMGIPALRGWTLDAGLRSDVDFAQNFNLDLMRPLTADNPAAAHIGSTADFIAQLRDMVEREIGVPFGVVVIPSMQQRNPKSFARYVAHHGLAGQDLDPMRAPDALRRALEARGVAVLDTLPALRAAGAETMNFPDDGHLTARGHARVADAVSSWLAAGMGHGKRIGPDR